MLNIIEKEIKNIIDDLEILKNNTNCYEMDPIGWNKRVSLIIDDLEKIIKEDK